MKILYLSEDYSYSKVHHNLCSAVVSKGLSVILFSIKRKDFATDLTSTYIGADYEKHIDLFSGNYRLYKYVFPYKTSYKYKKLKDSVNLNEIGLVHAATMFSDGEIALKLYKEYGIPYVVSVRGTDIELYTKYMFHLWPLGLEILKHASKVIFISPTSRDVLFSRTFYKKYKSRFWEKTIVMPNGIDSIWLENICLTKQKMDISNPRILYVGLLDNNKNVLSLMEAVKRVSIKYPGITLSIIGGGGHQEEKILAQCSDDGMFRYFGKIYDKDKLRLMIKENHMFAMVSLSETFGLVYVEAMTQGLPVLYSLKRGIDGFFSERIGEGVNPRNVEDIAEGLEIIIDNYANYNIPYEKLVEFSWGKIADELVNVYKNFGKGI